MMSRLHCVRIRIGVVVMLFAFAPALVGAQALPSLSSVRVTYNTRKATVKPQGELKDQIAAVDADIAEALRQGNIGEVRRQVAKGMTLLAGTPWTPALDYQNSLALRSERTVIDSSQPYTLRLEQIYRPATALTPALTVRVSLLKRQAGQLPIVPAAAAAMVTVREFGTLDGVPRDLRESPFPVELDLTGVADGAYVIEAEVFDAAASLGATRLPVLLQGGLNARLRALETGASALAESARADVLYPADFIRNVNRGRIRVGTFDLPAELASAEASLASAAAGKDPFKGRTGAMERHYLLPGADEVMPYRVYVPTTYTGETPTPLVIALHGLGGTEASFFESYGGQPPRLAESHGFLLAAPLGYRVDGFYGAAVMAAADAATRRRLEFSEKDVLEVLRLMRTQYRVDERRIYLIGHSMGAIGTWYLGAKYPDIWAALGLFAGSGDAASVERMKHIPQIVVHGDADPTVNVNGSRTMVAEMKRLGVDVTYIEVPGGNHTDVVVPNLANVFDFLAAHRKGGPGGG